MFVGSVELIDWRRIDQILFCSVMVLAQLKFQRRPKIPTKLIPNPLRITNTIYILLYFVLNDCRPLIVAIINNGPSLTVYNWMQSNCLFFRFSFFFFHLVSGEHGTSDAMFASQIVLRDSPGVGSRRKISILFYFLAICFFFVYIFFSVLFIFIPLLIFKYFLLNGWVFGCTIDPWNTHTH